MFENIQIKQDIETHAIKHAPGSIFSGKMFLWIFGTALSTVASALCNQTLQRTKDHCMSNTFKFDGILPAICVFNYLVLTAMVISEQTDETNAIFSPCNYYIDFDICLTQLMYIFSQLRLVYCCDDCLMYLKGLLTCYLLLFVQK